MMDSLTADTLTTGPASGATDDTHTLPRNGGDGSDSEPALVVHPLEPVDPTPSPPSPAGAGSSLSCEWCGKVCKSRGGLVRHQQACKARPADVAPPVGRRAAKAAKAAKAGPRPSPAPAVDLPPPKKLDEWTAAEGAERAAKMVDEVSAEGGSVVDVMARMDAGAVGIPDLIALVCLRALPPPLTDEEYSALRMAYKDREVKLPPWLMTLMVTLAVLGPRVAAHPVAGPWLRAQLVGNRPKKAPKRAPITTPPPPRPEPTPEPEAEANPAASAEEARSAVRAAMERMK